MLHLRGPACVDPDCAGPGMAGASHPQTRTCPAACLLLQASWSLSRTPRFVSLVGRLQAWTPPWQQPTALLQGLRRSCRDHTRTPPPRTTHARPQDIVALSARPYGHRAVLKFAAYLGAQSQAGRHTPGLFTNQVRGPRPASGQLGAGMHAEGTDCGIKGGLLPGSCCVARPP